MTNSNQNQSTTEMQNSGGVPLSGMQSEPAANTAQQVQSPVQSPPAPTPVATGTGDQQVPGAQNTAEPNNNANSPHVLLVEDDPLLIKMYTAKFTSEGMKLSVAEDGEAGFAAATAHNPDFIILDVMMPKMSGLDLLEKLRQNESTKNTKVLVLSNLSQEKEAKRALELGAKEYILKASLTPKELIDKVRGYLTE